MPRVLLLVSLLLAPFPAFAVAGYPLETLPGTATARPYGFTIASNGDTFLAAWSAIRGSVASDVYVKSFDAYGNSFGTAQLVAADATVGGLASVNGGYGLLVNGLTSVVYLHLDANGHVLSRTTLPLTTAATIAATDGHFLIIATSPAQPNATTQTVIIDEAGNAVSDPAAAQAAIGARAFHVRFNAYSAVVTRTTAGGDQLIYAFTRPQDYVSAPATAIPTPDGGVLVTFDAKTKSASFFVRPDGTVSTLHEYAAIPLAGTTIVHRDGGYAAFNLAQDSGGPIRFYRLDDDFVPIDELPVTIAATAYNSTAAIAQNAAGVIVIAGVRYDSEPNIQAVVVDPQSLAITNAWGLALEGPSQERPRIASAGNTFLSVWIDKQPGANSVRARVLDASGAPAGVPFTVAAVASPADLAIASNGAMYVVVWTDNTALRAMRFTAAGVALDAQPLDLHASGSGIDIAGSATSFLVVGDGMHGIIIRPDGTVSGDKQLLTPTATTCCGFGDVRVASDGARFLVTFAGVFQLNGYVTPQTLAVRVNANGDVEGAPVLLSADEATDDIASNGSEFVLLLRRDIAKGPLPSSLFETPLAAPDTQITAAVVSASGTPTTSLRVPLLTSWGGVLADAITWSRGSYLALVEHGGLMTFRFTASSDVIERRIARDTALVQTASEENPVPFGVASSATADVVAIDQRSPDSPDLQAWAYTLADMPLALDPPPAPSGVSATLTTNALHVRFTPPAGTFGVVLEWWHDGAWVPLNSTDPAPAPSSIDAPIPQQLAAGARFRVRLYNESGITSTEFTLPNRVRAVRH